MGRIVNIEKIFAAPASFSVIHKNRDTSKNGRPFPVKRERTCDDLQNPVIAQQIEDHNHQDTAVIIITVNKICRITDQSNNRDGKIQFFFKMIQGPDCEKSQEQCEKNVAVVPGDHLILYGQVKGYLRYQGKDPKAQQILRAGLCVHKTFYQKETVDWKCDASDVPHDTVKDVDLIQGRVLINWLIVIQKSPIKDHRCEMINGHGEDGDCFQCAAGKQFYFIRNRNIHMQIPHYFMFVFCDKHLCSYYSIRTGNIQKGCGILIKIPDVHKRTEHFKRLIHQIQNLSIGGVDSVTHEVSL